jgi:hydrogenase maturation protease
MPDLREQLQERLTGRICLVGIGNVELGDDGFGVKLAAALLARGVNRREQAPEGSPAPIADPRFIGKEAARLSVLIAGTEPERHLGGVFEAGFDQVVFLDAVEFGGAPGAVIFLGAAEMESRFPQVSTHKLSLGLLANWVEAHGATRAWLLGVQPETLQAGQDLSPAVEASREILQVLLEELKEGAVCR